MNAPPADSPRHRRRVPKIVWGLAFAAMAGSAAAVWTAAPAGESAAPGITLGEQQWTLAGPTGSRKALGGPDEVRIVPGDVLALRQTVHLDVRESARLRIDARTVTTPDLAPYVTVSVDIPGLADDIADQGAPADDEADDVASAPTKTEEYRLTPTQSGTYDAYLRVAFAPETAARTGAAASIVVERLGFIVEAAYD